MTHLLIHLLGPLEATLDGEPASGFRSDKARALLAYLCVEAATPHRRERLAGLLWPDTSQQAARANLRHALANVRQVIGDQQATPPFLIVTRQTIQLDSGSDVWVDVMAFLDALEATERPIPQLEEATAWYRGELLEGFSLPDSSLFEEWLLLQRERFRRLALDALDRLARDYTTQGRFQRALDCAYRQTELDPLRESAHRQLMRLLAYTGRTSEAVSQYETCRRLLDEELGVEPSGETTQLYERIRDGKLELLAGAPLRPPEPEPRQLGECPYRGLAAFREVDAPFFFGREDFSGRLAEAVQRQPMVVVIVGSSGSGKSSTVFAGLLPHLRAETDWLIAHFRPGGQPFHAQAAALLPLLEPNLGETDRLIEARKLADALRLGEIPLCDAIARALQKRRQSSRLLLVVDQFEELYTLCPEPDVRRRFLDGLLTAVGTGNERRTSPFVLLLTLRADFMSHALTHRPFADALQDASLMLGPMSRDELRLAIEKPAEKQGAAFEAGLVERLLDDVGEEPGNLPLLEFALTLLWERQMDGWLTHSGYEEIGRAEGALARYADRAFAELDKRGRERAQRIFVQLVRPGEGTADTRRMATRGELGDENWELVQQLADRRLVVTGRDTDGKEIVEVIHEALIQRWVRLRAWMDAVRSFRTWQEGLRVAQRSWETSDRDEGALLRGAPLAQAESWLAERGGELSTAERRFIQASVELQERRQAESEQRRRRTILALAGGLVIAIALLVMAVALAVFAFNARTVAQHEAAVNQSLVLAADAKQALDNGEGDLALALAIEAVNLDAPPPEAHLALSAVALAPGTRAILTGHSNAVRDGAISPDGRLALSGSCAESSNKGSCVKGELILWDLTTGTELRRFEEHTGWVNGVAFSPDGTTGLSASEDGTPIVWDVVTGEAIRRLEGHTSAVNCVAFSPDAGTGTDGGTALSGSEDGTLILWDMVTGEAIRHFKGHTGAITRVTFSPATPEGPAGQTALSASEDMTTILWDVDSGEAIRRFEGHNNTVTDAVFYSDGRSILSAGADLSLRLWDLETGEQLHQYAYNAHPGSLAVSPDGRTALLSVKHDLHQWDVAQWQEIGRLAGHEVSASGEATINSIAISADGRLALSASDDATLRLWNLAGLIESRRFETDGSPMGAVAVSPDGRRLLTGAGTDAILWDADSGKEIRRFRGDVNAICPGCVAFSPEGKRALVAAEDVFEDSGATSLTLWDVETGREIRRFEGHVTYVRAVAFSPDGRTALAGSQSLPSNELGDLILWDLETGQQTRRFDLTHDVANIAMSADGSRALTASVTDFVAILWDVATGQAIRRFEGHNGPVLHVAFGPDERTVLTGSYDGSLIAWDAQTGEVIRRYLGHHGAVWTLDVSPSGRYVISGDDSGTVILWDFERGEELRRIQAHPGGAFGVAFSPDSQTAFSVGMDGALLEWQITDPSVDELLSWVHENRYPHELTCEERTHYRVEPLCEVGEIAPDTTR
jgi:WD40 repeat protein/DNA-binding SARP family transcriptional activator